MRITMFCKRLVLVSALFGLFSHDSVASGFFGFHRDRDDLLQIPITDETGQAWMMRGHMCCPEGINKPRLVIFNHGSPPKADELYRQPHILVLDEATSHLDVNTERVVNQAIEALNITRIIISHRPETIAHVDRVIELNKGSVRTPSLSTERTAVAEAETAFIPATSEE